MSNVELSWIGSLFYYQHLYSLTLPQLYCCGFFLHYYTYLLFCIKYKNKHLSLFSDNIPKNSSTLSFHIAPVSIAFRISFFLLWSEIINSVVTT